MNIRLQKTQSGFALLIFIVILMGIGGLALTGFSQQALKEVEAKKFAHNKRVLEQAKQALLSYAYRYPDFNAQGPGRLPCPDTDNDGSADPSFFCINGNPIVGRLPWSLADLNFYDALDASGERLWYAVSRDFANTGPTEVNSSDSVGKITIFDQTGSILYDGATNGVAAVIIAPGTPLAGQDRLADPLDPANYLDAFGVFDNSVFINASNAAADGFRMGPVKDDTTLVINDQMVLITADEVIEMAEKATLQAYRDALADYQQKIWGTTAVSYRYPWLDLYEFADLTTYDADFNTVISDPVAGRVPTIFANYFSGTRSEKIDSELRIEFEYDGIPTWTETSGVGEVQFDSSGDLDTNINFSSSRTFYFWDGHQTVTDPLSPYDGIWEPCAGTAGTGAGGTGNAEDDCNRKTDGTFKTPADSDPDKSDVLLEVKLIILQFNSSGNDIKFFNADLKVSPLGYTPPANLEHAFVYADYNNDSGYLDIINDIDRNFTDSFNDEDDGPAFGASAADRIRVGIRFYPELPVWAQVDLWHDNIMLVYSSALKPDGDGSCTQPLLPFDGATNLSLDYCMVLENSAGVTNDKSAMLILASSNPGLVDDNVPVPGYNYADDLEDIFEGENATPAIRHDDITGFWNSYYSPAPAPPDYEILENNLVFDRRPANGNDKIMILDEL